MRKAVGFSGVFKKILFYIFFVALILGIVGVVIFLTFRLQGCTFLVKFGSAFYYNDVTDDDVALFSDTEYSFSVLPLADPDKFDFEVKIVANPAHDFSFVMGYDLLHFYSDEEALNNYSEIFSIEQDGTEFFIVIPKGLSVLEAVSHKYGGEIVLQDEFQDDLSYFMIEVTAGERSVCIPFRFDDFVIRFEPSPIVF